MQIVVYGNVEVRQLTVFNLARRSVIAAFSCLSSSPAIRARFNSLAMKTMD
jgi:hypothetical protein